MLEDRSYQTKVVDALHRGQRGIVKAPAASGKTIMAAKALMKNSDARYDRVLWLCNTKDQKDQGEAAIKQIGLRTRIDVVCASPSLLKQKARLETYDFVIVDECHHATAPMWIEIIEGCSHAHTVWGFSATPWTDEEQKQRLEHVIGAVIIEISRAEVQHKLSKGVVKMIDYDTPNIERNVDSDIQPALEKEIGRMKWMRLRSKWSSFTPWKVGGPMRRFQTYAKSLASRYHPVESADISENEQEMLKQFWREMIEERAARLRYQLVTKRGINECEDRNAIAVGLANEHIDAGDSVLILVGSIEQASRLKDHIIRCSVCTSKLARGTRRSMIEAFRDGRLPCMIATSLADEGLDVPRANVLILLSGGRSSTKIEQRTGRVLRFFKDKDRGVIYDFNDLQHYYLSAQVKRRRRLYESLGYQIEHITTSYANIHMHG